MPDWRALGTMLNSAFQALIAGTFTTPIAACCAKPVFARFCVFLALIVSAGCSDSGENPSATMPTPIVNVAPALQKTQIPTSIPQGSGFDFYVLSLSWSPQGYPGFCALNDEPTRDEIRSVVDLTPSSGLVRHEWKKHGVCSGLSPSDYFQVMRKARQMIAVPQQLSYVSRSVALSANQIENAFAQANPKLNAQAIAVDCDRQKLAEVRICLSKSLEFRACPEVDRAGCRAQSITIEPIK
jgi:ribonuclease T2